MVAQVEASAAEVQEGNASAAVETTPEVTQPEAVNGAEPEAAPEQHAEPAAEDSAEPTPPPDPQEWFKSLTEEQRRELPEVRDLLRREGESIRRTAEHETQRKIAERESQWLERGEYVSDFAKAVVLNDDGNPVIDQRQTAEIADRMWNTGVRRIVDLAGNLVYSDVPDDFAITRAEQRALEDAQAAYIRDPVANGDAYLKARLAIHDRAVVEAAKPELRKQIEADVRAEFAAKAQTDSLRQADAARKEQTAPTNATGTGPRMFASKAEARAAHARGEISNDDMLELRGSTSWDQLP